MKNISRRHPIKILSLIIGCVILIVFLFGSYMYGRSQSSQSIQTKKDKYDMVIKYETQTAVSLLQELHQQYVDGKISLDEAKLQGETLLRALRYGEDNAGYFWADTTDGINVVLLGNTNIEGTNRWDAFMGGVFYVREIIKNGMQEGGGFTDYYFPKKNDTIPIPKRGYSILFSPFNWVIGTGYYLEDIGTLQP